MVWCALPGLSDGGILGAKLVCGFVLEDERAPSPCKRFNGSDALEASAERNAAGAMLGLPDMQEQYGQLIIPAALKPEILRELAVRKGISGETIYTGLDGVGQAVAESVKLRVAATAAPASAAAPVVAPVRP
jgi:hypothetical protein